MVKTKGRPIAARSLGGEPGSAAEITARVAGVAGVARARHILRGSP